MPTNIDYSAPWLVIPESWKTEKLTPIKPPAKEPEGKPKREPAAWREMTDLEIEAATQLGRCSLPPATSTKRLARSMAAQAAQDIPIITDKQAECMWKLCWKFRRQIASAAVAKEAKRRKEEGHEK